MNFLTRLQDFYLRGSSWPAQMSRKSLRPGLPLSWLGPGGVTAAEASWARQDGVCDWCRKTLSKSLNSPASVSYSVKRWNATWSELWRLKKRCYVKLLRNNGYYYCQPVLNGLSQKWVYCFKKKSHCCPEGTRASKPPSSTKELWDWETIAKVKWKGPLHVFEIYGQAREPARFLFN